MFNLFKKKKQVVAKKFINFEVELTACVLAYEVARSDGDVSKLELRILLEEIKKIANKINKSEEQILGIIKEHSKNSVSFYEFIADINKYYSKRDKLLLIQFLWKIAYADNILEINEERLVRRVAELINIKHIEVLKIKDQAKSSIT